MYSITERIELKKTNKGLNTIKLATSSNKQLYIVFSLI